MTSQSFPFAILLTAAGVMSGCTPDIIDRTPGEIGIVSEKRGDTVTDREGVLDFGPIFASQTVTKKVIVKNLQRGTLVLTSLEKSSGAPVKIAGSGDDGAIFEVTFEQGTTIGPSAFVELEVTFLPPENEAATDYSAVLTLRAENTVEGEETATITLNGRGVPGVCKLPSLIDFGNVAVDDVGSHSFKVVNPALIRAEATFSAITSSSGDDEAFTFAETSLQAGTTTLEPQSERNVELAFRPTQSKSYLAFVKGRASAQCPDQAITLSGSGVGAVLSWSPAKLDFGYVTPAVEVVKEITFSNLGTQAVALSGIKVTGGSSEFFVVGEMGADKSKLTVPPAQKDAAGQWAAGTATLKVGTKPALHGGRPGSLGFHTDLAKQPQGAVVLFVYGGGPDIDVKPAPTLNFNKVAFFSGSQNFVKKSLAITNAGTSQATDPKSFLRLGKDESSHYFQITPLDATTAAGEFTAELLNYDPAKGLEAKAGIFASLAVKLTPQSIGPKRAKIEIFSNDPDEPVFSIIAMADAVELPPCNFTVSPTTLNFGLVSAPTYKDLGFSITNNGVSPGDTCLISNLALDPTSAPEFSLPAGAVPDFELQPGEKKELLVRVWPQGTPPAGVVTIHGLVKFYVSSPIKPEAQVSLTAQLAPSCLTIAPSDLDYGTVRIGCSSATRTFNIYNSCTTQVTLNAVVMQAGAEFFITQAPAIPPAGLVLNPGSPAVTFQAKYVPIDSGADTGAIAVAATQSGTNVTYVVALHAKGDTVGIQTDAFTQDAKPKADILMVIDDSGSMGDEQASLSTNFLSFIKYAASAKVDYHIAVTTTDMSAGGAHGRFVSGPLHPDKVLTPALADVNAQFSAKVNVGTSGSSTEMVAEPALKALTAPLITSENAGFLRPEAALAVVAVTDEPDQSPNTTTYYLNALWNIKGFNNKTAFTFNAISGFSSACLSDSGELNFYVTQTNGVKEDICTTDWAKTLEKLGDSTFGFRTHFFMTSVPDLTKGPIEVRIDNVVLPSFDDRGASIWSYDSIQNSVNFEPMYVPEPGQTLTITYHTTCYP